MLNGIYGKIFHIGKTDPVIDHFIGTAIPKKSNIRKVE